MKLMKVTLFLMVLFSCDNLEESRDIGSEIKFGISLKPALVEGYSITNVEAIISRNSFTETKSLTITSDSASGVFTDLIPGIYEVEVNLYEDTIHVAQGFGTGIVEGGNTTNVNIEIEFLKGELSIGVVWVTSLDIVSMAQHSISENGSFVIFSSKGNVYEVDPSDFTMNQIRSSSINVNFIKLAQNRNDHSIMGITKDGELYKSNSSSNWSDWSLSGNISNVTDIIGFVQHAPNTNGDFVFVSASGKVFEADPRNFSNIILRSTSGPLDLVQISTNLNDSSILGVTEDGIIYKAITEDSWTSWNQVGIIQNANNIVSFTQHSINNNGDFVFITSTGEVFEVDPRHLNDGILRTSNAPKEIVSILPYKNDHSIIGITKNGYLYKTISDDNWVNWELLQKL